MRSSARLGFALLLAARPAIAQVGHDPAHSPYRSLRYGQFISFTAGYFNGDGGVLGAAPHRGATYGLRYDFLGSGTVTGPVKRSAVFPGGILQFNLTGGKPWHHLPPFVSAAGGLVFAGKTPADTSGFTFHTRGTLTPGLGARTFLGERLFLRVEAGSTFWSVSYPATSRLAPPTAPTKPPVLTSTAGKEWTATGWYSIGLSYAFHRPF